MKKKLLVAKDPLSLRRTALYGEESSHLKRAVQVRPSSKEKK
jgi:hypothetical protein